MTTTEIKPIKPWTWIAYIMFMILLIVILATHG